MPRNTLVLSQSLLLLVFAGPGRADDGIPMYRKLGCISCHGADGRGMPGSIPPLAQSPYVVGAPEKLARILLYGTQGPITVEGVDYDGSTMPAFEAFTDQQLADVSTYIRASFGNRAQPVGTDLIARVRAAGASVEDSPIATEDDEPEAHAERLGEGDSDLAIAEETAKVEDHQAAVASPTSAGKRNVTIAIQILATGFFWLAITGAFFVVQGAARP